MEIRPVLYLDISETVRITSKNLLLRDLGEILCSNAELEKQLEECKVPICITTPGRYVLSITDLIESIQKEIPEIYVENLGAAVSLLTYETKRREGLWYWCKVIGISLIAFFGGAFSIMSFHNDIGIQSLIAQMYNYFLGKSHGSLKLLETAYSIGVTSGILIYFQRFGPKKSRTDPSPMAVQMRVYEDDVNQTLLQKAQRTQKRKI